MKRARAVLLAVALGLSVAVAARADFYCDKAEEYGGKCLVCNWACGLSTLFFAGYASGADI